MELGEEAVRKLFDDEEWTLLSKQLAHAMELDEERELAAREGRDPQLQHLVDKWGGVTLVYRKGLNDSPAYRLNHEEVAKSLEEGIRYVEHMSPTEAVLDVNGHVDGIKFMRNDGTTLVMPARTVCVAAGTSPNVTYERELPGSFKMDARNQYFAPHSAIGDCGRGRIPRRQARSRSASASRATDFSRATSIESERGFHAVSYFGDNHPHYAGSVVKAMASAKDGFPFVRKLFPELDALDPKDQPSREHPARSAFTAQLEDLLRAEIVAVNRLTATIVEVVVRAPLAARKFQPGQFYRLQNFEADATIAEGTRLAMEGLALTGAWIDEEKGLLGTIVLEMGGSSRLCASLKKGDRVILMGPTGAPTEIDGNGDRASLRRRSRQRGALLDRARLQGDGREGALLRGLQEGRGSLQARRHRASTRIKSSGRRTAGSRLHRAGRRMRTFRGNIVQAMVAYSEGKLGAPGPSDENRERRRRGGD